MSGLKVAIVGSRTYPHLEVVRDFVRALPAGTVVVSGGAPGVDQAAATTARKCGLPKPIEHFARWQTYGKRAGSMRNRLIVRDADLVVAFWDGASRGTENTIMQAEHALKPAWIIREPDRRQLEEIVQRIKELSPTTIHPCSEALTR